MTRPLPTAAGSSSPAQHIDHQRRLRLGLLRRRQGRRRDGVQRALLPGADDVAYIEASLGNSAKAAAYNQAAGQVRDAINANLLNAATGTYYLSESDHTTFAQDANALAVLFGVAPEADVPGS